MKRYDAWSEPDPQCGYGGGRCELYERTLGQYVTFDDHEREVSALRAELARVKAESLRVVVDGEVCSIREARNKEHNMYEGRLVEFFVSPICHEVKEIIIQDAFSNKKIATGTYDTIVQPVRLERWEDE